MINHHNLNEFRNMLPKIEGFLMKVMKVADYKMSNRICDVLDNASCYICVFMRRERMLEASDALLKEIVIKK